MLFPHEVAYSCFFCRVAASSNNYIQWMPGSLLSPSLIQWPAPLMLGVSRLYSTGGHVSNGVPPIESSLPTLVELEKEYEEIKRQRSAAAHGPNQDEALEKSKRMVDIANAIYDKDPTSKRLKNLEYARYYAAVSGCVVAELSGNFEGARECATEAARAAKCFRDSRRFFPNFFFDEAEIASYEVYLEAVRLFRDGCFRAAADGFEKWLVLNGHRKGTGAVRYDCNQFHQHRFSRKL